jgi:hypothetical protein
MIAKQIAATFVLVALATSFARSQDAVESFNRATEKAQQPTAERPTTTERKDSSPTVAYWRFEGDGKTTPAAGTFMTDTADRTGVFSIRGSFAIDSSGNGNTLYTWNANFTGHQYHASVPAEVVPQTGAANSRSIRNYGAFPCSFTWSRESKLTGVDLETISPPEWTIEASINRTRAVDLSTFVGRDGMEVATGPLFVNGEQTTEPGATGWAPLYFQSFPLGGTPHLTIQFTDMAGYTHRLIDREPMEMSKWYNVAAVSDGKTLSLYKDSGDGYVLVNSTSLAATESPDTRMGYDTRGASTASDKQWSWTVGRGRVGFVRSQGDGHDQRWMGYIDEVRISTAALKPSEFLFSPKDNETPSPLREGRGEDKR